MKIIKVRNIITNETYEAYFTRFLPGEGWVDLPVLVRIGDRKYLDITTHLKVSNSWTTDPGFCKPDNCPDAR